MNALRGLDIRRAPKLRDRTSIRLGGAAIAELRLLEPAGFEALPDAAARLGGRIEPFGAGTNILADDTELPLLLLSRQPWVEAGVIGEQGGKALYRADGATGLPALLTGLARLGLSGLEGLAGIPGSVGGAVAMNAGSYGVCLGERVHSLAVFSPGRGYEELKAEDVEFSYRRFGFAPQAGRGGSSGPSAGHCKAGSEGQRAKVGQGPAEPGGPDNSPDNRPDNRSGVRDEAGHGETERDESDWFLVCSVTLALEKDDGGRIKDRMRAVLARKRASQPVSAMSAGCVFKNPAPEAPAGLLLERAGLKGRRIGAMAFSDRHANFMVNEGEGTFAQARELIDLAVERVRETSGYLLQTEVRVWP